MKNMRHRIFIAINLPEKIRKNLTNQQLRWADLPCRWTKEENLHITLAFLGTLGDEELVELCRITKEVAASHEPFGINLVKIVYGPNESRARMIWVQAKTSKELEEVQKDLGKNLPIEKEKESRKYAPHITLGRLKQWEFNKLELEERPQVNEAISLFFEVKSIDIMESDLRRSGPEYSLVESFPLIKE